MVPFWIGMLIWLLSIVAFYLLARQGYNAVAAQLPDHPEARRKAFRQRFWWEVRFVRFFGIELALPDLPIPSSEECFCVEGMWVWRLVIPAWVATFFGFAFANSVAYFPLDRCLRESTWSLIAYLRWKVAQFCWTNGLLFGWLFALEVLRQVALSSPLTGAQPLWTIGILGGSLALSLFSFSALPRWLFPWERVQDEALLAMLGKLAKQVGLKPLKLWQVTIPGGRILWSMITPNAVVVSDYLREQLTDEEMQGYLALKLARLKLGHMKRQNCTILGFLASETIFLAFLPWEFLGWIGAFGLPFVWLAFVLFYLWQRTRWQQQELVASQWAAQLLNDPKLVARVLEKVRDLSFPSNAPFNDFRAIRSPLMQ